MRFLAPRKPSSLVLSALFAAACGEPTSPPKPAGLTATSSTSVSATVGTAVTAPSVKVTTAGGAPVSGIAVQFSVTAGNGTLGRTSATTDASGSANAGSWVLGTTAGTQSVDATVNNVGAVRFTATATAAAAATLTAAAGDNQAANIGELVSTAPAVLVKDQFGNPVSGASVTFSVQTGGGTLSGATATSGTDGVARVGGWTLGIATGSQTLRATSGSLTATFSATGRVPSGCTVTNYGLGVTLMLNWDLDDCTKTSGRRYDRLQFTTTTQQAIEASVTGASGRWLYLRHVAKDLYVGLQPGTAFSPADQNPMKHKYVLAPGTYQYEVIAPDANTTGSYTFATTTGTRVDCQYIVFASPGVQFTDSVNANSCLGPGGGREQWINLQLKTGMKVRLTLIGAEFPAAFLLRDDRLGPASPTLVFKSVAAGETSVIDWTATFDTWHEVIVAPTNGTFGKYTLKIEELP